MVFRFLLVPLLWCGLLFMVSPVWAQDLPDAYEGEAARTYLVDALARIGEPVLQALSEDQLRARMPVEAAPGVTDRPEVTHLEAFGRLLAGMAPWLELGPNDSPEGQQRAKFLELAHRSIQHATDPEADDFMNFTRGAQPLVDAAFFAHALIRAPEQLWEPLDAATKANVIAALKSTRQITPYYNNWLLFSGMVEAALLKFDGYGDRMRLEYALDKHREWYLGDGIYGDGPNFHWDYYNSFVIQPMMLDILRVMVEADLDKEEEYQEVLRRARRYAAIQERLIGPEGTYPPIGRSIAYRFGAFQLLSQIALWEELPDGLAPAQVRSALYAVIRRQIEAEGTFDEEGWLQIGLYGHQPNLGERYISTGSLYLCAEAFLLLGLPADDTFWTEPPEPWTQRKIWSGQTIPIDHAE